MTASDNAAANAAPVEWECPSCGTRARMADTQPADDGIVYCRTLGHEQIPAVAIGEFYDGETYQADVPYCDECAKALADEWSMTRPVNLPAADVAPAVQAAAAIEALTGVPFASDALAQAVLAAVEPLIRADQREKDAALIEASWADPFGEWNADQARSASQAKAEAARIVREGSTRA